MMTPRLPRDAGHDAEDGGQSVVGSIDRPRNPRRSGPMPGLSSEDALEVSFRSLGHSGGMRVRLHVLGGQGMRPLVFPELRKKPVCVGIACGAPVQVIGLSILESFTPREHFLHGGKSDLQACPGGETLGRRVVSPHPEVLYTCFYSWQWPALSLRPT